MFLKRLLFVCPKLNDALMKVLSLKTTEDYIYTGPGVKRKSANCVASTGKQDGYMQGQA